MAGLIEECGQLLEDREDCPERFRASVDWAAKLHLIEQYRESAGLDSSDPALKSVDLAYHDLDPESGLFSALVEAGQVEPQPDPSEIAARLENAPAGTRAWVRGLAVRRFGSRLKSVGWPCLTFLGAENEEIDVELRPDVEYARGIEDAPDVESFVKQLREANESKPR
jgi:proteasome accessory factor A